jgi:hypothetical protein
MSSHRGLSAVVGTVFLVAVVIGALSYVSYSMDVLGNFSESLIAEESRQKDKQGEAFEISSIDVTGANKLDGVIKNTGEIPLKITTLWIDEQGVNDVVQKYILDAEIAPGNTVDLSSLVDVDMDSTKGYNMKIVTSRGEVNSFYVNSLADENIYMTLVPSSQVIPSTFSTSLLFTVVNNMSNGNYLYNLTPVMNDTKQILVDGSLGLSTDKLSGPIPTSYDSLGPGEVAVFTYEYQLSSSTDLDTQLFNVTLANANLGNEALASVHVKSVPLATEAGSSLTSLGITETTGSLADVLYFHAATTITPNGEFQMDGSSPKTSGITLGPNEQTIVLLSPSVTEITTVAIGDYTVALNYFSSAVPIGFPEPSFAFFMDCRDCGDNDEIGSSINTFDSDKGLKEWSGKPEFSADGGAETPGGGPDGDEYYHFDDADNDEMWDDWGVEDNNDSKAASQVGNFPDTDALWVRIEPTSDTSVPILNANEYDWGHNDYYGFWLIDAGEIRYGWETAHSHHGSYPDNRYCDSPAGDGITYDDDQWHHIVGVRDAAYGCKLYIDGVLMASANSGSGDGFVGNEYWALGYDMANGVDFDGDIASWIHWNSDTLDAAQVEDLYYTNYGNNGTRLHYKIEVVDETASSVVSEIIPLTKIELPFKDVVLGNTQTQSNPWVTLATSNTTDKKYYGDANGDSTTLFQSNMTATDALGQTLQIGERLKLTLDWNGFDESNLPINIMWDDSGGWSLPDGPTYLQTPEPTPRWPTYLSFEYDANLEYLAFNEGPDGIWFTFPGTRFVLTTLDGLNSYAAMPQYANFTTAPSPATTNAVISPERDSLYIPDQAYAEIDFWQIQAPPAMDNSPCGTCEVPSGDYDAALYLSGYDERGETFLRTVDLGLVHITGNP